jgi:hypothetical protein
MSTVKAINLQHPSSSNTNLVMDSSGRVGIGTSSPEYILDVSIPSGPYISRFTNSNTATSQYNAILIQQGQSGSATGYLGTGGSSTTNPSFRNTFVVGTQSANDLVLNTNDTERMRIDSSGRITTPYRPAFFAYLGSEQSVGTSATKVTFQNTVYNVGSCFSTVNSRFIVPVTGLYQFNMGLYPYPVIRAEMYIFVNGSPYQRFQPAFNTSSGTETNPNGTRASSSLILNANDYVELFVECLDSAGIWNGGPYSSYFQGYLVG